MQHNAPPFLATNGRASIPIGLRPINSRAPMQTQQPFPPPMQTQQQQQQPYHHRPQPIPPQPPMGTRGSAPRDTLLPPAARAANAGSDRNPFDLLGIPRNTNDLRIVDAVYQKWVMKTHPDRGGDPRRFQLITQAYEAVKEVIRQHTAESFDSLRTRAQADLEAQMTALEGGKRPEFNIDQFNTVFADNRLWNPEHEGYGKQMVENSISEVAVHENQSLDELLAQRKRENITVPIAPGMAKRGSGKPTFNANTFNDAFLTEGRRMLEASSKSMVKHKQPQEAHVFKTSTSNSATLSADPIDDFSSPFASGGGAYTDYMLAFSEGSLITPHVVDEAIPQRKYQQYDSILSSMSYDPSPELQQEYSAQQAAFKESEEQRWANFLKYQEQVEQHHRAINKLLNDK